MNNKNADSSINSQSVVLIPLLLLVVCLLCLPEMARADHRVIIRLLGQDAAGLDNAALELAVTELGERSGTRLLLVRQVGRDALLLTAPDIDSDSGREELLERLRLDPRVDYANSDQRSRVQFVPNDPVYVDQWNLYEDAGGIRMPSAWDLQRGDQGVVTAVIDTGVLPHIEIESDRILPGYDFFSDTLNDNDGTPGRDDDPVDPGDAVVANECEDGSEAANSTWHGTSITGIVAATTDNLLGVAGIDHQGLVLVARAFGKCGGFTSDVVDAMRWVAGLKVSGVPLNPNPARIINLSSGGINNCSFFEQDAINEVVSLGVSIVVAAGNDAASVNATSPANCNNVIVVAATSRSGARAGYTNTGARVDISAPGGVDPDAIPVLFNTGETLPDKDAVALALGTSYSAAQVTGVVALMLAQNSKLSPQQVEQILKTSARPFPDASCDTTTCGAGIVDAENALDMAANAPPETPATVTNTAGNNAAAGGGGGGGGGGCTLATSRQSDPLFPLLLAWALFRLMRIRGRIPEVK